MKKIVKSVIFLLLFLSSKAISFDGLSIQSLPSQNENKFSHFGGSSLDMPASEHAASDLQNDLSLSRFIPTKEAHIVGESFTEKECELEHPLGDEPEPFSRVLSSGLAEVGGVLRHIGLFFPMEYIFWMLWHLSQRGIESYIEYLMFGALLPAGGGEPADAYLKRHRIVPPHILRKLSSLQREAHLNEAKKEWVKRWFSEKTNPHSNSAPNEVMDSEGAQKTASPKRTIALDTLSKEDFVASKNSHHKESDKQKTSPPGLQETDRRIVDEISQSLASYGLRSVTKKARNQTLLDKISAQLPSFGYQASNEMFLAGIQQKLTQMEQEGRQPYHSLEIQLSDLSGSGVEVKYDDSSLQELASLEQFYLLNVFLNKQSVRFDLVIPQVGNLTLSSEQEVKEVLKMVSGDRELCIASSSSLILRFREEVTQLVDRALDSNNDEKLQSYFDMLLALDHVYKSGRRCLPFVILSSGDLSSGYWQKVVTSNEPDDLSKRYLKNSLPVQVKHKKDNPSKRTKSRSSKRRCYQKVPCENVPCENVPCENVPCENVPCENVPCEKRDDACSLDSDNRPQKDDTVCSTQRQPVPLDDLYPDGIHEDVQAVFKRLLSVRSKKKPVIQLYGSHGQRAQMWHLYQRSPEIIPRDWDFKLLNGSVARILHALGYEDAIESGLNQLFLSKSKQIDLPSGSKLSLAFTTDKEGRPLQFNAKFLERKTERESYKVYLDFDFSLVNFLTDSDDIEFAVLGRVPVLAVKKILNHYQQMADQHHRNFNKEILKIETWYKFEKDTPSLPFESEWMQLKKLYYSAMAFKENVKKQRSMTSIQEGSGEDSLDEPTSLSSETFSEDSSTGIAEPDTKQLTRKERRRKDGYSGSSQNKDLPPAQSKMSSIEELQPIIEWQQQKESQLTQCLLEEEKGQDIVSVRPVSLLEQLQQGVLKTCSLLKMLGAQENRLVLSIDWTSLSREHMLPELEAIANQHQFAYADLLAGMMHIPENTISEKNYSEAMPYLIRASMAGIQQATRLAIGMLLFHHPAGSPQLVLSSHLFKFHAQRSHLKSLSFDTSKLPETHLLKILDHEPVVTHFMDEWPNTSEAILTSNSSKNQALVQVLLALQHSIGAALKVSVLNHERVAYSLALLKLLIMKKNEPVAGQNQMLYWRHAIKLRKMNGKRNTKAEAFNDGTSLASSDFACFNGVESLDRTREQLSGRTILKPYEQMAIMIRLILAINESEQVFQSTLQVLEEKKLKPSDKHFFMQFLDLVRSYQKFPGKAPEELLSVLSEEGSSDIVSDDENSSTIDFMEKAAEITKSIDDVIWKDIIESQQSGYYHEQLELVRKNTTRGSQEQDLLLGHYHFMVAISALNPSIKNKSNFTYIMLNKLNPNIGSHESKRVLLALKNSASYHYPYAPLLQALVSAYGKIWNNNLYAKYVYQDKIMSYLFDAGWAGVEQAMEAMLCAGINSHPIHGVNNIGLTSLFLLLHANRQDRLHLRFLVNEPQASYLIACQALLHEHRGVELLRLLLDGWSNNPLGDVLKSMEKSITRIEKENKSDVGVFRVLTALLLGDGKCLSIYDDEVVPILLVLNIPWETFEPKPVVEGAKTLLFLTEFASSSPNSPEKDDYLSLLRALLIHSSTGNYRVLEAKRNAQYLDTLLALTDPFSRHPELLLEVKKYLPSMPQSGIWITRLLLLHEELSLRGVGLFTYEQIGELIDQFDHYSAVNKERTRLDEWMWRKPLISSNPVSSGWTSPINPSSVKAEKEVMQATAFPWAEDGAADIPLGIWLKALRGRQALIRGQTRHSIAFPLDDGFYQPLVSKRVKPDYESEFLCWLHNQAPSFTQPECTELRALAGCHYQALNTLTLLLLESETTTKKDIKDLASLWLKLTVEQYSASCCYYLSFQGENAQLPEDMILKKSKYEEWLHTLLKTLRLVVTLPKHQWGIQLETLLEEALNNAQTMLLTYKNSLQLMIDILRGLTKDETAISKYLVLECAADDFYQLRQCDDMRNQLSRFVRRTAEDLEQFNNDQYVVDLLTESGIGESGIGESSDDKEVLENLPTNESDDAIDVFGTIKMYTKIIKTQIEGNHSVEVLREYKESIRGAVKALLSVYPESVAELHEVWIQLEEKASEEKLSSP